MRRWCLFALIAAAMGAQGAEYPVLSRDHWAARAVAKLEQLGWLDGYPDGDTHLDRDLIRQECTGPLVRFRTIAAEAMATSSAGGWVETYHQLFRNQDLLQMRLGEGEAQRDAELLAIGRRIDTLEARLNAEVARLDERLNRLTAAEARAAAKRLGALSNELADATQQLQFVSRPASAQPSLSRVDIRLMARQFAASSAARPASVGE